MQPLSAEAPRFVRSPGQIARELEGEVLIVPLREQVVDLDDCFYLLEDPISVLAWELLAVPRSLDALAREVEAEYEVAPERVRADLRAFLADLERIGAVDRVPPSPERTAAG